MGRDLDENGVVPDSGWVRRVRGPAAKEDGLKVHTGRTVPRLKPEAPPRSPGRHGPWRPRERTSANVQVDPDELDVGVEAMPCAGVQGGGCVRIGVCARFGAAEPLCLQCLVRVHYVPKGHTALPAPVEGFADSCRRVTSDHGTQTSVCESCGHGAFEIRMLCCASELCVACLEKERGVCPFC